MGRSDELRRLDTLIFAATRSEPAGVVAIAAINGSAGIGKTALALRWAHQVCDRYPDGQLYVNLRGFDSRAPMAPEQALQGFLSALGLGPNEIPADLDAAAALYRGLLAERRVLVVLDNARDTEHIRPLLPGDSSCAVIITSRNRLDSLIVREGAHRLPLDVLGTEDAIELLAAHIGSERMESDRHAVVKLIELCVRLPLALSIVAARAASQPSLPLDSLVNELDDERVRLDALDLGDTDLDLRAVFSWSYQALDGPAANLFRLLGIHPGPDIGLNTVASMIGAPIAKSRFLLTQLTRAHLIDEYRTGRYRFHDLLRSYAAEKANELSPEAREAALTLMFNYYLTVGVHADKVIYPYRESLAIATQGAPQPLDKITTYEESAQWFSAEYLTILAVARCAYETGAMTYAWQLPWILGTYYDRRGYWHDFLNTQRVAAAAAEAENSPIARAYSYRLLGRAYSLTGHYQEAIKNHERALHLFHLLGSTEGQARALRHLSLTHEENKENNKAFEYAENARHLFREANNKVGQARSLNSMARCAVRLGNHEGALTYCNEAMSIFRSIDRRDKQGEADSLHNLGYIHHHLGNYDQAAINYAEAIQIWRYLGSQSYEAATLAHLGDAYLALGRDSDARAAWSAALAIFGPLHHPDTSKVNEKLIAN
ncbi:ATP-binding protein [Amycolatopsis pretoriensis]|uniref:ATP-binding protein n=1 Tax=Amycolatopsis pretoriensis TaxID=218821 RepID=UPI0013023965|nr:tetratricopeptide repeat protein [Amycolatopsis pretoriensis]